MLGPAGAAPDRSPELPDPTTGQRRPNCHKTLLSGLFVSYSPHYSPTRRGGEVDNMRKYSKPVAKKVTTGTVLALMA